MSLKNIIFDIPDADAVEIGQELARRMKNMFAVKKRGFATPYKDFIHHHMPQLTEIVIDAIAVPAGLKVTNLEATADKSQLQIETVEQTQFSMIQWPKHLDFIRIFDEHHRLWKLDWKNIIPNETDHIMDTTQNVRHFPRAQVAALVAEKENHSREEHKSTAKRFRGLTEYLLPASDRVITPHDHTDLVEMDRKHAEKSGDRRWLKNMIQPWKGARKGFKNNNGIRGRSRSRSKSVKRAFRGASVSPMRRKVPRYSQNVKNSSVMKWWGGANHTHNGCVAGQCCEHLASTAEMTLDQSQLTQDQSQMNASIADTTILSGQSQHLTPTDDLSSDKNVSFNVTGKSCKNNTPKEANNKCEILHIVQMTEYPHP